MRIAEAGRMLVGGAVVYIVMAACATGSLVDSGPGTAGSGGTAGAGGSALGNPVRDARAAVSDVVTEPCKPAKDGGSLPYAEHAYPGKTVVDLSALRVIGRFKPGAADQDFLGYGSFLSAGIMLRDGMAATYCNPVYDSVTFVLPGAL